MSASLSTSLYCSVECCLRKSDYLEMSPYHFASFTLVRGSSYSLANSVPHFLTVDVVLKKNLPEILHLHSLHYFLCMPTLRVDVCSWFTLCGSDQSLSLSHTHYHTLKTGLDVAIVNPKTC